MRRLLLLRFFLLWGSLVLRAQLLEAQNLGRMVAEGEHVYRMIDDELTSVSSDRAAFARRAHGVRETWTEYLNDNGVRSFIATRRGKAVGVEHISHCADKRGNPLFVQIISSYQQRIFYAEYRFTNDSLRATLNNDPSEQTALRLAMTKPFSFVSHPLCTDGLHFAFYDSTKRGKQTHAAFLVSTKEKRSLLGALTTIACRYDTTEEVTVPAGTFPTKRWTWWIGSDWSAQIWLDAHLIPVKMKVPGMEMVLTRYRRGE